MEDFSDNESKDKNNLENQIEKKKNFFMRFFSNSKDLHLSSTVNEKNFSKKPLEEKLSRIKNLHSIRVADILIPKSDIKAISDEAKLDDVVNIFSLSNLTRIPVYNETLDNPLGLIHLKDFAIKHGFNGEKSFDIKTEIRPLLYVPPSMSLDILLQKMQTERIHMALVIDEYGGVDGLVTIEDLLEQIVGDIIDEHDVDEGKLWTKEKKGIYLVHARLELQDFSKQAGINFYNEDNEYETIGGLVFSLTNRIPVRGELVKDKDGNEFSIVDADPRRIKRIRIYLSSKDQ